MENNLKILKTEKDIVIKTNLASEFHTSVKTEADKSIDAYEKYFKEKDESNKYRISVTINPICSNVLFNTATEVVINEGSPDCHVIAETGDTIMSEVPYVRWKGLTGSFGRNEAIQDTAISHKDILNASYNCGYDIFNNHFLRRLDFSVVSKTTEADGKRKFFNTLSDYLRNADGENINEEIPKIVNGGLTSGSTELHMYQYDTIRTFQEAVEENLVEKDGWFGFVNPSNISFENYSGITINRCINNRPAGAFIDMYPGRDLYSFIPKYNSVRKRREYNWDFCLTYPYANDYNNELVADLRSSVNGLSCTIENSEEDVVTWSGNTKNADVILRTRINHNLSVGSTVRLIFISGSTIQETEEITVNSIGKDGENFENYFTVKLNNIQQYFTEGVENVKIRVRKLINGYDCKYYLRKFKRIPNFKFSNVYEDGIITDKEISDYCNKDFSSFVRKMAFAKNIYSDDIAQITFTDDILTNGLKDNLGRDLTEIYLTIVKSNRGHEEWKNGDYGNEKVEYSHCFGNVSSGFDIFGENGKVTNYDIHKICGLSENGNALETGITIGESGFTEFYGDIVEFSPNLVVETEISPVLHRFNTIQRETETTIGYDDIVSDDYSLGTEGFKVVYQKINNIIFNEGYYYRPHYPIRLREFSDIVKQGNHIRMLFTASGTTEDENTYSVTGTSIYHLFVGDKVKLYKINGDKTPINGIITEASPFSLAFKFKTDTEITNLEDYFLFKLNENKPPYAVELEDGSGRYLWREIESFEKLNVNNELYNSIFTNGAHYRYLGINFYLRRQDPEGVYFVNDSTDNYEYLDIRGKEEDYSNVEFKTEEVSVTC